MIQGKKKTNLSIETILERTTEGEIYRHFFGDFTVNQVICNKFRGDKNPSLIIGNKYGNLQHFDFSDSKWRGDCFALVKQIYGLTTLDSILRLIDLNMNLGITNGLGAQNSPVIQQNKPIETKRNTLIQVVTKPFTKEELSWWNEYHQDISDLKREEVYSIKKAYLNKKLLGLADLRFGYFYNGFWKLYQPLENKRKKWLTNCPLIYLEGKENIKNCETAWITKSKKDKMCLLKLFSCVAATQNESVSCFSEENVEFIRNNSKKQVIIYDSDDSGVRSCQEITKKFNFGYCNPPKKYLPEIKDFSDLCKIHGIQAIREHLTEKRLI